MQLYYYLNIFIYIIQVNFTTFPDFCRVHLVIFRQQSQDAKQMLYALLQILRLTSKNLISTILGTARKKSDIRFTSLKFGNTVKIKGKSFKITAIANNAFRGYNKLKSMSIKNIKRIVTKAFY